MLAIGLTVAAVLAWTGVVVALQRGDDERPVSAPELRWTLDGGAGWTAYGAAEVRPVLSPHYWPGEGDYRMALYGTHDDPSAPTVILAVGDAVSPDGFAGLNGFEDIQRHEANDRVVGCGTNATGWHLCFVQVGHTIVQAHSRGLADGRLEALLTTATVERGTPLLEPGALPAGMSHLRSWEGRPPGPISTIDPTAVATQVAFVDAGGLGAGLQVGWADEQELAAAFESAEMESRVVGGVTYFVGVRPFMGTNVVVWEQDERAFFLTIDDDPALDPVSVASTVHPATAREWAAATRPDTPLDVGIDRSRTTMPDFVAITTVSPVARQSVATLADGTEIVDVPVSARVNVIARSGAAAVSVLLPDGTAGTMTLLPLPGAAFTSFDGEPPSGMLVDQSLVLQYVTGDDFVGVYALSTGGRAATLQVTRGNGERYVTSLVPHPTDPGWMMGYLVVPANEMVSAAVLDQFGEVLDHIG